MNNKRIIILVMTLLGFFAIPVANADVVVRYIVVNDGHSYREPFDYQRGNRLYSNTSRLGNITYSNGSRYRDQCVDDRYYEPRQYRNNYYYGFQNRYQNPRAYQNDYNRHDRRAHDRRSNYGHHRDAPHGSHKNYGSSKHYDNHSSLSSGGRVHITIK